MLGIITFFSNNILPLSLFLFVIILICAYKNIISSKFGIIIILIFSIGIINTYSHIKYFDDLSSYTDNNVTVNAQVVSIPTNSDLDKTKFYAQVNSIACDDKYIDSISAKSIITISDKTEKLKEIKIGDTLRLTGSLRAPMNAQNPSQFDYARYLQLKNTFSLMYVDDNWEILCHSKTIAGKFLRILNDTRTRIINIHAQNIKSPMIEILGGIIFGDDAVNPDNDTKTSFINSGIFHILAASGMNVTLIFGIWFFFATTFKFNYRFSIITGMLLILFYTCMTGFGPPIIRASLMLLLILAGKLIYRKTPTMSMLFLVAFLMLLYNPLMIFDIGFQLSFIVTFALILTAPLMVLKFKHKFINYTIGACLVPIIAQLFAAPLQMYYFNTFAVYSVFANIAIIPVLSIVSFIGFISSILAIIPAIANKICFISDILLNPLLIYIVKVANFFSNLPLAIIYLKKPCIIQLLLYFAIIVSLICILRFKIKSKRILLSVFSLILILLISFIPIKTNKPEVLFFSVGNADAILIKSPNEEYFLIDSGRLPYKKQLSQAKTIIIKYLTDKGIKDIDSLVLTHFDSDHAGGTIDLLKNLNIKKLYITDTYEDTKLSSNILSYIQANNINASIADKEEKIYEENNFIISIVKPNGIFIKDENEKSIIVRIKYYDNNLLFMGDGNINSFESLPDNFKNNILILKSGHHGAKDTINKEMLKNTNLTIISTGKNNYNHPHPETINLLEKTNKEYLRTDYHNAIKIIPQKDSYDCYLYSPKFRKFLKI